MYAAGLWNMLFKSAALWNEIYFESRALQRLFMCLQRNQLSFCLIILF